MAEPADISPEDSLRLNVLLAQAPEAIRIDEARMVVHALTPKGEARIELNPNAADETYLRRVKSLLSSHATGSPGGYPVFLDRWTRMGQARDQMLEQLLLLGESEAVVAVVHAPGLDARLARRAWWAMPDAANARAMLRHAAVAESEIGRELAIFLLEFLPFEEKPVDQLESVRLLLQPGLVDAATRDRLWRQAQNRRGMLVGFIHAASDDLPLDLPAHPALERCRAAVHDSHDAAELATLAKILAPAGQACVATCIAALEKLPDQEVAVSLFQAMARYFASARVVEGQWRDAGELERAVAACPSPRAQGLEQQLDSLRFLSAISVSLLDPIFARTDSIGSGMRRKLQPVTDRILYHLERLGPGSGITAVDTGRRRGRRSRQA
ncbi:MAG: sulfur reduction protein DsrS [Gammaproteobacteria bacterium]|nr:sulfur reduction protein DsrS [Gammaproteobacteria bacterium]